MYTINEIKSLLELNAQETLALEQLSEPIDLAELQHVLKPENTLWLAGRDDLSYKVEMAHMDVVFGLRNFESYEEIVEAAFLET